MHQDQTNKPKRKITKAQIDAVKRWEDANYDKVLLRLPKGTKDRIKSVSSSVNGFISDLVLNELDSLNK